MNLPLCKDASKLDDCLPEIRIRDVSLNKLVQRVVDDFLEVHRVLLLKHKSKSRSKGSYNKQRGRLTLNNQTHQWSPMYQIWSPVGMLQKRCLRKLGCESFPAASSAATVRILSSDFFFSKTSCMKSIYRHFQPTSPARLARMRRYLRLIVS